MDVLHSFINDKKIKSKLNSKASFSHMYKNSDKVGGVIHSKLPKMTMPKMDIPKIVYNTPKYKHHPTARNFQNMHFSSLIRRDKHSRNETSSAPAQPHVNASSHDVFTQAASAFTGPTQQTPKSSTPNSMPNYSTIFTAPTGPASSKITASAVTDEKGRYGERFKNLQVAALTDTEAKALLPTVSAQLAAGLTPDVTTLKQLEPYLKVGALQQKPTDTYGTTIASSRISKGTGFTGPGDPVANMGGVFHESFRDTTPQYMYSQPGPGMFGGASTRGTNNTNALKSSTPGSSNIIATGGLTNSTMPTQQGTMQNIITGEVSAFTGSSSSGGKSSAPVNPFTTAPYGGSTSIKAPTPVKQQSSIGLTINKPVATVTTKAASNVTTTQKGNQITTTISKPTVVKDIAKAVATTYKSGTEGKTTTVGKIIGGTGAVIGKAIGSLFGGSKSSSSSSSSSKSSGKK